MSARKSLPSRRGTNTFTFVHDGVKYHAGVGRFGDGRIAELFLNGGKAGSAVNTMSRDAAVVVSLALQHEIPLENIRSALAKLDDNSPAGPVGVALKIASEL